MEPHNIDPLALRSVVIFNLAKKVNSKAEMPHALELITAPLWSRFEHHGFLSGTSKFTDSAMIHSVGVDDEVFILGICAQEPVSYEWTISIDRMPPLWKRLLGLSPRPLRDTPATRRLLAAINEALQSDASFSQISWHKKEVDPPESLERREITILRRAPAGEPGGLPQRAVCRTITRSAAARTRRPLQRPVGRRIAGADARMSLRLFRSAELVAFETDAIQEPVGTPLVTD